MLNMIDTFIGKDLPQRAMRMNREDGKKVVKKGEEREIFQ